MIARNRKLVEMGLVRAAQAIAERKVKVTVADLDRLIRLEEFLREDLKGEQTKIVAEWKDFDGGTEEVGDEEDVISATTDEED